MNPSFSIVLLVLVFIARSKDVQSYSKVLTMGSGNSENGPKIYKAMNMDLIFPKTFNSSEHVISTTQTTTTEPSSWRFNEPLESLLSTTDDEGQFTPGYSSLQTSSTSERVTEPTSSAASGIATTIPTNHYHPSFVIATNNNNNNNHADNLEIKEESEATLPPPTATGRAVDYRPAYPFSQLLTSNSKGYSYSSPSVVQQRLRPGSMSKLESVNGQQRVVYPSYQASRIPSRAEIDKLSGKGQFSDRFTPAEGVASNTFKLKQNRNKPSITHPIGQTSNKVTSFLPNQDLYAFPPNINSRYPLPTEIKQALPSDPITSYLPPAAGPLDNGKFVGPVNPDLLPESMKKSPSSDDGNMKANGGYQYNPPKESTDGDKNSSGDDGYHYNPPQSTMDDTSDNGGDQAPPLNGMDDGDTAPEVDSDMMDESPPADHHDDHHDHHEIGSYVDGKEYPTPPPGYFEEHDHDDHPRHHHHPDIEFSPGPVFHDHHPHDYPDVVYDDFHGHHFHHDHHPLPMTTEPPPPPPEPEQPRVKKYSYFYIGRKLWYIPLYFTVWFTFYVLWLILKSIARHKVNLPNHYVTRRSIDEIMEHREARESIDKLTVKVMEGIENFKLRFVG